MADIMIACICTFFALSFMSTMLFLACVIAGARADANVD